MVSCSYVQFGLFPFSDSVVYQEGRSVCRNQFALVLFWWTQLQLRREVG